MRDEEHNRSAPLPIDIQALARESRRIYLKIKRFCLCALELMNQRRTQGMLQY